MPEYKIVLTKTYLRDSKKLDANIIRRIIKSLETLKTNPYQGKKLISAEIGKWRLRVGNYRIRYDIEDKDIILYRVRHRKDIYR